MPTAILPPEPTPWKRPAKTMASLPWADIKVLDLSTFDAPGGKQQLAEDLRKAVHETGFFSLINTGISEADVQRQYDIGQTFFNLPLEVKDQEAYRVDFEHGNYFGYKAPHTKTMYGTAVKDNSELINIPKFIPANAGEPFHPALEVYRAEIESFSRRAAEVARKVFTLFALLLELPADYFASRHDYDLPSDDHLRYMGYHPRSAADDALIDNTWARAHTDFGSLTLLWSQDVAGLQIKTSAGEWRYVPPVPGAGGIVCNVGDTLQFWSAGYLKSTTHRVVRPPADQAHLFRQGLFYFVRPGNDVAINPAPSPLLKRLGLLGPDEEKEKEEDEVVTGLQYVRERVKNYHNHSNFEDRKGATFRVGNLEIEDEAA